MKTQFLRLLCPLSAMTLWFCLGNSASAQSSLSGSSNSQSGSSIPHHVGKNPAAKDVLDNPRLSGKVSIERKATTVEQALNKLGAYTILHLVAEGAEVRSTPLLFHYTDTPLRDILASIAETGYWEWIRKNENTLVLKARFNPHLLDVHRPRNEAEKEVYERGAKFLDQFDNLPPDMQAALGSNGQTPAPSFNTLPPAMQDNIRAMFAAYTASQNGNLPMTADNVSASTVRLRVGTPQEGLDHFDVRLIADVPPGSRSGVSMSFVMFHDPRDGYNVVPRDQLTGLANNSAALDALSRQKALATNKHLQEMVSLKMVNVSLFQALQVLSTKVNLSFSSQYQPGKGKPVLRSFSLPTMPLGEMLDKLTALYSAIDDQGQRYRYTWGQQGNQESQVFVLHISFDEKPSGE